MNRELEQKAAESYTHDSMTAGFTPHDTAASFEANAAVSEGVASWLPALSGPGYVKGLTARERDAIRAAYSNRAAHLYLPLATAALRRVLAARPVASDPTPSPEPEPTPSPAKSDWPWALDHRAANVPFNARPVASLGLSGSLVDRFDAIGVRTLGSMDGWLGTAGQFRQSAEKAGFSPADVVAASAALTRAWNVWEARPRVVTTGLVRHEPRGPQGVEACEVRESLIGHFG